jgi:hypothetical protein
VGGPEAFESKAFAGRDLLGDLRIGVVKEEQVITGKPDDLFDELPIISFVAALLGADAVDVYSNPEWFHPRPKHRRQAQQVSRSIS